jgi:hypothetical protein
MTLRLGDDGTVGSVLLPEAIRGVSDRVALNSVHRQERLLLCSVSSALPEHLGGRARARLKDGYRAA